MEKALGLSLCSQVQVHMSRGRPGDSEIWNVGVQKMKLGNFQGVGSLELPGKTTLSERGPVQLGTHSCLCWGLSECTQPKPFLQLPLVSKSSWEWLIGSQVGLTPLLLHKQKTCQWVDPVLVRAETKQCLLRW